MRGLVIWGWGMAIIHDPNRREIMTYGWRPMLLDMSNRG